MKDLAWLRPDGSELSPEEWRESVPDAFGFRLCGQAMDDVNERGEPITADTLLVLLNARADAVRFVLPRADPGDAWELSLDTADDLPAAGTVVLDVGAGRDLPSRSLAVLRACRPR
jgi:glycogen operon protein